MTLQDLPEYQGRDDARSQEAAAKVAREAERLGPYD